VVVLFFCKFLCSISFCPGCVVTRTIMLIDDPQRWFWLVVRQLVACKTSILFR
jgi:hypothetical protein